MMKKFLKYIFPIVAVAVAGCSSGDKDPDLEIPDELRPDEVTLCLNVSFDGTSATRAEKDPDRYDPATGDFEKVQTLRVLIVHDITKDEATGKTTALVEGNRLVSTNDQGTPLYDNLEFKVKADDNKRVYLIANEKYLTSPVSGTSTSAFLDSYLVSTPKDKKPFDLDILTNWTVSLPGLNQAVEAVNKGMFSQYKDGRLPLTEFFDIKVGTKEQSVDNRWFSHLFLTRCAAKAQFFLKTSDAFAGEGMANTRITGITLEGIGTTEYVFPNTAEYAPKSKEQLIKNGADITATLENAYIKSFQTPADNRTITYKFDNINVEVKKPLTEPYAITDMFYFPESFLAADKKYRVGVQFNGDNWFYAPLETNILNIGGQDAIARNTYLPIVLEFDEMAQLTVRVLPWNREDYYVDYTDNVGIIGDDLLKIEGTPGQNGDYLMLDVESAQLVLNYGKVARGQFKISSPLAATWDAYMITTGGTTDAIQFQIPDPADATKTITTTHISGKVGDPAEFGIVATVAPGSQQNSAQMMVIVTLANGTPVVANVLGDKWGTTTERPDRLTIIENQQ